MLNFGGGGTNEDFKVLSSSKQPFDDMPFEGPFRTKSLGDEPWGVALQNFQLQKGSCWAKWGENRSFWKSIVVNRNRAGGNSPKSLAQQFLKSQAEISTKRHHMNI